jgi:hypothetical protein
LVVRVAGWLVGWLVGWPAGWLARCAVYAVNGTAGLIGHSRHIPSNTYLNTLHHIPI